jgi:hypothetical protein
LILHSRRRRLRDLWLHFVQANPRRWSPFTAGVLTPARHLRGRGGCSRIEPKARY